MKVKTAAEIYKEFPFYSLQDTNIALKNGFEKKTAQNETSF